MKTILYLTSSIFGDGGQSSRLAAEFVAAQPGTRVIARDLARNPVPHLDAERFGAFLSKPEDRTPAQQRVLDESDALIAELKQADTLVLGLPMYNFGVPSQLKAWFDHVARLYAGTPKDTQTAYVRDFLAFLGIAEVKFVYAEGLAVGEASKTQSLAAARNALRALVQPERIAA
jgi:FMN-dependent NADH-azoreductase